MAFVPLSISLFARFAGRSYKQHVAAREHAQTKRTGTWQQQGGASCTPEGGSTALHYNRLSVRFGGSLSTPSDQKTEVSAQQAVASCAEAPAKVSMAPSSQLLKRNAKVAGLATIASAAKRGSGVEASELSPASGDNIKGSNTSSETSYPASHSDVATTGVRSADGSQVNSQVPSTGCTADGHGHHTLPVESARCCCDESPPIHHLLVVPTLPHGHSPPASAHVTHSHTCNVAEDPTIGSTSTEPRGTGTTSETGTTASSSEDAIELTAAAMHAGIAQTQDSNDALLTRSESGVSGRSRLHSCHWWADPKMRRRAQLLQMLHCHGLPLQQQWDINMHSMLWDSCTLSAAVLRRMSRKQCIGTGWRLDKGMQLHKTVLGLCTPMVGVLQRMMFMPCTGIDYAKGRAVAKDDVHAVHWNRLAVEQGYAAAQYNLGCMYDTGSGVAKDEAEAVHRYRLAAKQGHAAAQRNLQIVRSASCGVETADV